MLHDMLIGTFQDGEYFIGIIFWVLFIIFIVLFLGLISFIIDEYQWSKVTAFEQECTLLNQNYTGSTVRTNAVPVVSSNGGVGMGVVTTGDSAKHVTVWDCGKYGKIIADDEKIFRFAKDKSVLYLKERNGEVRIVDIKV